MILKVRYASLFGECNYRKLKIGTSKKNIDDWNDDLS